MQEGGDGARPVVVAVEVEEKGFADSWDIATVAEQHQEADGSKQEGGQFEAQENGVALVDWNPFAEEVGAFSAG